MAYFPGFTWIEILRHFRQRNPDQCEGRIIFMSMIIDVDWTEEGNSDVSRMPEKNLTTPKSFSEGIVLRNREKRYGT